VGIRTSSLLLRVSNRISQVRPILRIASHEDPTKCVSLIHLVNRNNFARELCMMEQAHLIPILKSLVSSLSEQETHDVNGIDFQFLLFAIVPRYLSL
jgi:hypothetical protein